MDPIIVLLSAFLISVVALGVFIWSMRNGVFGPDSNGAKVIFTAHEVGRAEDPAAEFQSLTALQRTVDLKQGHTAAMVDGELAQRAQADRSSATVTFVFLSCAIGWLLLGSFAGLISSIKLHSPDWLGGYEWLTFGRIRTIHLNAVAYGWTSMAGLGLAMWMLPRLLKTALQGARFALLGAVLWNAGLIAGIGSIAVGLSTGLEWLEMPWQVDLLLVAGGALIGIPLLLTLARRTVDHLRLSLVPGSCALLVSDPVPGRQPPGCALRRGAGDDELVVRPQRARLFLYSTGAGGDLLLPAESDRTADPILQPVAAGILDASVLLRDGRCTPSDRRTSPFLADHAFHRTEHDDDRSDHRVCDQLRLDDEGLLESRTLLTDLALYGGGSGHVRTGIAPRVI